VAGGLCSARVSTQVADLRSSLSPWPKDPGVTDLVRRLETFKGPRDRI